MKQTVIDTMIEELLNEVEIQDKNGEFRHKDYIKLMNIHKLIEQLLKDNEVIKI